MKNITILLLLLLVSCSSKKHRTCIDENPNNWEGTYIGVQCLTSGVIVKKRLTLKEDATFELFINYRGTSKPIIERYSGNFKLDKEKKLIDLFDSNDNNKLLNTFYEIESDSVLTASLSRYQLEKGFSNDLTHKEWYYIPKDRKLSTYFPEGDSTLSIIKFDNDGLVTIQTNCGYYHGDFEIDNSRHLAVSNLNETYDPCCDSLSCKRLLEIFEFGHRYKIVENVMELMDEDNNIVATFSQSLEHKRDE